MSKKKSKDLSRREFLRVSAGAVVAASIGCGGDDDNVAGASGSQTGQGGAGGGANTTAGTGGALPKGGTGAGGRAAGSGGAVTGGTTAGGSGKGGAGKGGSAGGTTASGGTSASGGAGAGGSAAGAGGTGGGSQYLVSMVRRSDSDWATAVQDAIRLVGGLPNPEKITGKTVMIRPNVISPNANPETTNPEVIRGVIRAVKAHNPANVIVAEYGFANDSLGITTLEAMTRLKITNVCTEEGAQAMDLKGRKTVPQSPTGAAQWPGGIPIYEDVLNADYVINVPVCKTHSTAFYSMAIKGWFGCVSDRSHGTSLGNKLAEVHLAKQENFVVLDATKAMVTRGPTGGAAAEPKIVVASKDPIAADVTGLCIIKQFGPAAGGGSGAAYSLNPWAQPQILRAMALKFPGWLTSEQKFEYAQEGVTEHEAIMAFRDA